MDNGKHVLERKKHLFQVEILIEEPTNSLALAALLQALNHPNVKDFRVVQGIELGKTIEKALQEHKAKPIPIPAGTAAANAGKSKAQRSASAMASPQAAAESESKRSLENLIRLKESGTLVRLVAIKEKGVRLSIPCRILNFDPAADQLTIYHVDEKKVYSFKLNEIEDIIHD